MGEKDEKPIRVVDRRMFTPDGELRPGFEPEEPAPAPAPPPPPARPPSAPAKTEPVREAATRAPSPPPPREGEAPAPGEDEIPGEPHGEFTAIVRSLATTAY